MTQTEMVKQYMKDFGSISQAEAFTDLGVMRLAARIADLRNEGVSIIVESETSKNRYGEKVTYARYRIAE